MYHDRTIMINNAPSPQGCGADSVNIDAIAIILT